MILDAKLKYLTGVIKVCVCRVSPAFLKEYPYASGHSDFSRRTYIAIPLLITYLENIEEILLLGHLKVAGSRLTVY